MLLYNRIEGINTLHFNVWTEYAAADGLSVLLYDHIEGIDTLHFHGQTEYAATGRLS